MGIITRLTADYTNMVPAITQYGEVVHFPTFDRIGAAEEMPDDEDFELTPEKVSQTDSTATVKQIGKAVRISDKKAKATKASSIYDEYAKQIAEALMMKVELDIIKEIDDNAVFTEPIVGGDLTLTVLQTAMNHFGDKRIFNSFAGFCGHSRFANAFLSIPGFTDLTSTTNNLTQAATNGIMDGANCIGFYNAIPIYLTDVGTLTEEGDPKLYILKKRAAGRILQRGIQVESGRRDLAKGDDLSADMLYAVKLLEPKGVVVIK